MMILATEDIQKKKASGERVYGLQWPSHAEVEAANDWGYEMVVSDFMSENEFLGFVKTEDDAWELVKMYWQHSDFSPTALSYGSQEIKWDNKRGQTLFPAWGAEETVAKGTD